MSVRCRCVVLLLLALVATAGASLCDRGGLPGRDVPSLQLDAVVAADGCGQFCTTQGQQACTARVDCDLTIEDPLNAPCVSPGAECGSCTGGTDIVCGGELNDNGEMCSTYPVPCCPVTGTCATVPGTTGGEYPVPNISCQCVSIGGPSTWVGIRVMCRMEYNYVDCGCL